MAKQITDREVANLKSICQLLDINSDDNNKLNLLKCIVDKLDTIDDVKNQPDSLQELKSHNITNSLAFPDIHDDGVHLDESVWSELSKYNDMLQQEYSRRREILLSRLNCTVESFKWKSGASTKNNDNQNSESKLNQLIHQKYEQAQELGLRLRPNVNMANLIAARADSFDSMANTIVSSKRDPNLKRAFDSNDKSNNNMEDLKRVIIPNVPDRGGRTNEIRPPQKETLYSQQRGRGRPYRGRGRR